MGYLLSGLLGYLLGSSSMAWYLSKLKKVDLRAAGSDNLGASNATLLLGWGAGVAVGAHDGAKGVLAVVLARFLFPELPYAALVAGVASVLGHIYPFYLKFKGGKGFATYLGMTLALNWKFALVLMALVVLVTLITDYIVAGTTLTILSAPVYLGWSGRDLVVTLILLVPTAVIVYKHLPNYVRIWKGTEIGLRSAARGDHRVQ